MRINGKELVDLSFGQTTLEGRLHHKKISGGYSHSVFKERWFKLRANILFYFNLSESGQILHKKPVGAFILENSGIQYEMISEVPFSFSIYFNDEKEKKHLFSCRTQENVNKWVSALKQASYEYWRSQLILLQEKIKMITGQDPLLLYPRNTGSSQVFNKNTQENACQTSSITEVQNSASTSHFYIQDEINVGNNVKRENKPKKENKPLTFSFSKSQSSLDSEVTTVTNSPPVRPVRGNKPKQEVPCDNLIDLK